MVSITLPLPSVNFAGGCGRREAQSSLRRRDFRGVLGRLRVMAHVWEYPLVNAHNCRAAFAEAPEPGLLGGVVLVAPVGFNQMLIDYIKPDQTFIGCPKQDIADGAGFTALDKEPTVVQVPDFGDRFYVYAMYDQRTDENRRHRFSIVAMLTASAGRPTDAPASTDPRPLWSGQPLVAGTGLRTA
jgi:hypothetical protein